MCATTPQAWFESKHNIDLSLELHGRELGEVDHSFLEDTLGVCRTARILLFYDCRTARIILLCDCVCYNRYITTWLRISWSFLYHMIVLIVSIPVVPSPRAIVISVVTSQRAFITASMVIHVYTCLELNCLPHSVA